MALDLSTAMLRHAAALREDRGAASGESRSEQGDNKYPVVRPKRDRKP